MNKLMGFYELKDNGLPSVEWRRYDKKVELDDNILWTIRCAVEKGDDLNLPRLIGATAEEAKGFANALLNKLSIYDLIIYYPYFIAEKSGVLEIALDKIVIEAVYEDLWNLVTDNNKDVTMLITNNKKSIIGKEDFFSEDEISKLLSYVNMLKNRYRDYLLEGKSIFLEWSFSYKSTVDQQKIGDKTLVFYEIRTV